MIYLSTGGYSNLTGYETAKHFVENDIRYIELSGGRPDDRVVDKPHFRIAVNFKFTIIFLPP